MFWLFVIGMIVIAVGSIIGATKCWHRIYDPLFSILSTLSLAAVAIASLILCLNAIANSNDMTSTTVLVTKVVSTTSGNEHIVRVEGVTLDRAKISIRCDTPELINSCSKLQVGQTVTRITVYNELGFSSSYPEFNTSQLN